MTLPSGRGLTMVSPESVAPAGCEPADATNRRTAVTARTAAHILRGTSAPIWHPPIRCL
jgi:hypothetical protein